jgi:hypothetical protein
MANPLGAMMAESEGFQRKIVLAFYTILLVAGVALYWAWGAIYDTWSPFTRGNIGIYTIYIILIFFGFFGILLNWKKPSSS